MSVAEATQTSKAAYRKKTGTYKLKGLREKQQTFGTIVLESDLNLPPETVYKAHDSRWEKIIEGLYRDRTFIIMLRPPPARQKEFIRILTLRIRYYEEYEKPQLQKQLKEITGLIEKLKKESN